MLLNERQISLLTMLSTYRYLTTKQLVRLGIYKTEKGLRDKVLSRLKTTHYPLLKSADFGFIAGKGRLSQIHYLTKRGALALADYQYTGIENIPYPIGQVQFSRDYFHRVEFISIHISLRQWAESEGHRIDFFHSYFDSTGNQRQRNSQLIRDTQVRLLGKNIVPDGNFRLDMKDGQSRLFTLELHKGTNTKRIIDQLENHARLIERELLPQKYNHPYDNYVLSVYDHKGTMEAVKRRFLGSDLLKDHSDYYVFSTVKDIEEDFSTSWNYFNNCKFLIFDLIKS